MNKAGQHAKAGRLPEGGGRKFVTYFVMGGRLTVTKRHRGGRGTKKGQNGVT